MPDFESEEYRGCWVPSRRLDGRRGLLLVVKRSWRIEPSEEVCLPAEENDPIRVTPVLVDSSAPAVSDVRYPADLAPEKGMVDILVTGEACAPGGKAMPRFEVGLTIEGVVERRLEVLGARSAIFVPTRKKAKKGDGPHPKGETPRFTEPKPVASLPLSYEYAYGGGATMVLDEETRAVLAKGKEDTAEPGEPERDVPDPVVSYPANPAGRGFCIDDSEASVEGLLLPQIEALGEGLQPADLVRDVGTIELNGLEAVPGFAPLPVSWFPRAGKAGVMPWDLEQAQAARDRAADELEAREDMKPEWVVGVREQEIPVMTSGWYQDAHPALQVPKVLGDERVRLENLTRHGEISFELPGRHPWVHVRASGVDMPVPMILDTLHFDLDDERGPNLHLVWRGFVPLPSADAVANASDAVVQVRDLPQPAWLVRRQDLFERQAEPEPGLTPSGRTVEIERVVRDDSAQ